MKINAVYGRKYDNLKIRSLTPKTDPKISGNRLLNGGWGKYILPPSKEMNTLIAINRMRIIDSR
jgi:hypothetical protein